MKVEKEMQFQTEQKKERFTKQQLANSHRYKKEKDLIQALLEEGRLYSQDEVTKTLIEFKKGRVK